MGAIDALLSVKLDSERMHQVVLSALLCKSTLLERLGISGTPKGQFEWEPQRGLYDIMIPMENQGPLLVEVKVNSDLKRRQITRQLEGLREQTANEHVPQLLYLVIGTTRFTTNKGDLESIVPDVDSTMLVGHHVHYRDVAALIDALAGLRDARDSKDGPDMRNIARGYLSALRQTAATGEGYSRKRKEDWDWQNHLRFFDDCRTRVAREGCGLQYTPNPAGGFLEYYFHKTPSKRRDDVKAYMRFEFARKPRRADRFALVVRIVVADKGVGRAIRDGFHASAMKAGENLGVAMSRPSRFALGGTMTVAQFPETFDIRDMRTGKDMDWDRIRDSCAKAEEVVKEACRIFDRQSV